MQRLCGWPFCVPALKSRVALIIQPPENRRAFRHEFVALQRIHVAIACPTSIALPKQRAPTELICHRDNQKACQDSLRQTAGRFCETPLLRPYKYLRSVTPELFACND